MVERLEARPYPLPQLGASDLALRPPRPIARSIVVSGVSDAIGVALARAYAGPGVRLCLIGSIAVTLEQTAVDCRQRGALVETFCLAGTSQSLFADYLAALDRHAPVDALLVHAGRPAEPMETPDVGRYIDDAMSVVAAIGDKMRGRGRGEIVLVSPLAGRAAPGDPVTALRIARAFRTYGAALRRRSRAAGVSVAIVAPRGLALRPAARLGEPGLAMVGADRIAERTLRQVRRRRAVILIPGRAALLMDVLRLVASRVRQSARIFVLPSAAAIDEPEDEARIAGKSATGAAGAPGD